MRHTNESPPAGVVPRRQAQALDSLMADAPERCTVAEELESAHHHRTPLPRWLSTAASFGLLAAALEWLKLTR